MIKEKTFDEFQKLIDFFHKKFEKKKVNYIYNYPQKNIQENYLIEYKINLKLFFIKLLTSKRKYKF